MTQPVPRKPELFLTLEQVQASRRANIDAAKRAAALGLHLKTFPLTRQRRDLILRLVAAGLGVKTACAEAQVDPSTFRQAVRRDPDLAAQLEAARDASIEEVEDRLRDISLNGPINNMATVRAAEVLLKGHSRRYNDRSFNQTASATVETPGGTMSVKVGTPGPD